MSLDHLATHDPHFSRSANVKRELCRTVIMASVRSCPFASISHCTRHLRLTEAYPKAYTGGQAIGLLDRGTFGHEDIVNEPPDHVFEFSTRGASLMAAELRVSA